MSDVARSVGTSLIIAPPATPTLASAVDRFQRNRDTTAFEKRLAQLDRLGAS